MTALPIVPPRRAGNGNRAAKDGRTREQQARDTRDALLKAALRVVARHGYAMASVSRVTEAAGVAQGTFYSYFENHQQLLQELLPTEGMRLLDVLGRESRSSGDYFDHERRAFVAFFKYLRRNPHFLRVLTEAEVAAPASHAEHMNNIEERYLGALRRAQAQGHIRPQSDKAFRVIAEVLAGARGHIAIGLNAQTHWKKFNLPPDWAADTYLKFIRIGLGEQRAAPVPPLKPTSRLQGQAGNGAPHSSSHTRQLLLMAAAKLVHEHGHDGATIARITQAANVAVGTFYSHFKSRQQLLGEVLDDRRLEMFAHVRECVRGSRSFTEVEQRGFLGFFDYLRLNPTFIHVETAAAVWAAPDYTHHFIDIADSYVQSMRRSKSQGGLPAYDDHELPILAYIFMAARHYISTRYVLHSRRPRRLPDYVSDAYLKLVRCGLRAR